jgi:chorismate dehydratase
MSVPGRSLVRIGAVGYLNARPLTWALDRDPERWNIRHDLPSVCAALLQAGAVDLGLTPSIEYLHAPDYRFVPGIGIGSRGPVASVAIFATRPMEKVRTIALDTSSRTSVALTRVLCHDRFHIEPEFVPQGPDLATMVATHDAALLIGDPALEADADALGLIKIDLGETWLAMTGLPFVFAAWTGRPGAVSAADVVALQTARDQGLANIETIAAEYAPGDPAHAARAAAYLRDNVRYGLGPEEVAGLQLFLDRAAALGLAPRRDVEFFS